ncbi:hypothetical protein Sru01_04500 [Sphaerisporangium rufum]|uniref:Lipoprotein n=1 Tax=Sphaerisporangium rufum TaxID=1381558 RepID=A0A919QX56_9ACTN|nr:hypothetical protein [Sphaerisporangium rufum]GII75468.1 hypothetical protein Sru01_04500 [Sphaerisporangium rufum]
MIASGIAAILLAGLLAGCGAQAAEPPAERAAPATVPTTGGGFARALNLADARSAIGVLAALRDAWRRRDCDKIQFLTAAAAGELGGRPCQAAREGRPAPANPDWTDVRLFIPTGADDRPYVVALARRPRPAYFVFARAEDRWRLAYGPVEVVREAAEPDADQESRVAPPLAGGDVLRARLAPQKHLAFLADPAGLSGVRFAADDPVRDLRDELARRPGKVRPDRLEVAVRVLPDDPHALPLPGGGALAFHAVKIIYIQRATGRRLAHPIFGRDAVRDFTGKASPAKIEVTELVTLATKVAADGRLTTVGMTRALAGITG